MIKRPTDLQAIRGLLSRHRVVAVLDIDSAELNQFSKADIEPLAKILDLLIPYL